MGVPRLDRYVRINYKKYITFYDVSVPRKGLKSVYALCLDSNPLIHKAAQKVFNYGSYKRRLDPYKDWTYEMKIGQVFKLVWDYIVEIFTFIKCEVLYIAIDGVAPLSKQNQQRQRRFRSSTGSEFDSNCITAGTQFMHNMTKYLNYHIRLSMNRKEIKSKVIFSSHTSPGEGEHKIMDYIRTLDENKSVCMFGPDGDLIMLGLASFREFYLLKENMYEVDQWYILNMKKIREELVMDMGLNPDFDPSVIKRGIYDFIFLGFFLGNDFLPKLQMFFFLEDGIELFMKVYKKIVAPSHRYLISENGEMIKVNILRFLSFIQRDEIKYITKQYDVAYNHPKFINETLNNCVSIVKKHGNVEKVLDFSKYRSTFYSTKLNNVDPSMDYLDGMSWTIKYYVSGCPTFHWIYKHHYPPFLVDLLVALEKYESKTFTNPPPPHLPFEQLCAVLPPKSYSLLPQPFKKILLIEELKPYFNTDIEVDYEGKTQDYQGIILTEFVDFDLLKQHISTIKLKYSYARNMVSQNKLFEYDSKFNSKYTSEYGTINHSKVRISTTS